MARLLSPNVSRFRHSRGLLFEPDTGLNNPAGGISDAGQVDTSAAVSNLIARHTGDMRAVVDLLYRENHTYRQQNADLRGQIPAQGAVVLAGEEATRWQAYTALGDVATLQTRLQERDAAQQELATTRAALVLRDVASIAGFDREALAEIGGTWNYVIKDETVDGKAAKVAYVKDGDQETKLTDHPKVQKFMAVLKPQAQATQPARGTPAAQAQRQQTQAAQTETPRRSLVRF